GDPLGDLAERLPAALIEVGVTLDAVDVQVFLVHAEDGQAERDRAVVPDGDAGQGRFARADDVQPRRRQVGEVAQGRRGQRAVRVGGQHRPAGRGAAG